MTAATDGNSISAGADTFGCDLGQPTAERAVVGALLQLDAAQASELLGSLGESDFTDPRLRAVFRSASRLHAAGRGVDLISVEGDLRERGDARSFTSDRSAAVFLLDCVAGCPWAQWWREYARFLLVMSYRRRVREAGVRLAQAAGRLALDDLNVLVEAEVAGVRHAQERLPGDACPAEAGSSP